MTSVFPRRVAQKVTLFLRARPTRRALTVLCLVWVALILAPLLAMSFYAYPTHDDFPSVRLASEAWATTGSLWATDVYKRQSLPSTPARSIPPSTPTRRSIWPISSSTGADFIAGSHPHVVQGMEVYNGRYIFYSMGNFCFGGNVKVRALESCALRLTLTFDDDGTYLGQQLRVYAANVSGDPEVNDFQPRLVTGEAAEAVWARIDAASEGQEGPVAQGDGWRDYAYLPAPTPEATQTPHPDSTPTPEAAAPTGE